MKPNARTPHVSCYLQQKALIRVTRICNMNIWTESHCTDRLTCSYLVTYVLLLSPRYTARLVCCRETARHCASL